MGVCYNTDTLELFKKKDGIICNLGCHRNLNFRSLNAKQSGSLFGYRVVYLKTNLSPYSKYVQFLYDNVLLCCSQNNGNTAVSTDSAQMVSSREEIYLN